MAFLVQMADYIWSETRNGSCLKIFLCHEIICFTIKKKS